MRSKPAPLAAPELAILSNEAALHSLKRPQLLALCKNNGLKGSGKNVALIARLLARGRFLATCDDLEDSCEAVEESTSSWTILSRKTAEPSATAIADGGGSGPAPCDAAVTEYAGVSASASSTLQTPEEAPPAPAARPTAASIYPSLSALQGVHLGSNEPGLAAPTVAKDACLPADGTVARPPGNAETPLARARPFVFGSPVKEAGAASSFSFTMPGTFSLSTSSATKDDTDGIDTAAIDAVMEEMTRRATEARAAAESSGIPRSNSSAALGSAAGASAHETSKGKKANFDISHKRTFDRMDSITNHWAAKRSINSSVDLSNMTRSKLDEAEPRAKRVRPISQQQSARLSARDDKFIAALRESGWSSTAEQRPATSLADDVRTGVASQARRKRQLEMAKARRKSGVSSSVGLSQRRPSLGIGPKSSKLSTLYRATVRKPPATPSVPPRGSGKDSCAPPSNTLRAGTSRADLATKVPDRSTPRFAAPTASTSARAALTAAASPSVHRSGTSPRKPTARHFDLQESLKRPMSWRNHLRSSAVTTATVNKSESSKRAAFCADETLTVSVAEEASYGKLFALPQAPTSPFTVPMATSEPSAPKPSGTASGALSTSTWQPPLITKGPLLPSTPRPAQPPGTSSEKPTAAKKTVSASSRSLRGTEKATARKRLEGLDSHARLMRAKAAAAKARIKPT